VTLTVAQVSEVITLGLLPMLLLRLQVRGTLFLGLAAWAGALTAQAMALPLGLLVPALTLNGVCIACFLVAGQLYVNRQARPDVRASAQGLFAFINGAGLLVGHVGVGWVRQDFAASLPQAFVPAAMLATVLVALFVFGFTGPSRRAPEPSPAKSVDVPKLPGLQ